MTAHHFHCLRRCLVHTTSSAIYFLYNSTILNKAAMGLMRGNFMKRFYIFVLHFTEIPAKLYATGFECALVCKPNDQGSGKEKYRVNQA